MKILKVLAVALSAAVIVGCGKEPKLPEGTVVAAYVDIQKVYGAGKDIAETIIGNLPKKFKVNGSEISVREEAEKSYKEAIEQLENVLKKANRSTADFKWIAVSVSNLDKAIETNAKPMLTLACYVKGLEKLPEFFSEHSEKTAGETTYRGESPFRYVVLYKEHLLAADTKEALETLVATYKGDKSASSNFGDLTDLDGATVARIQVAGLSEFFENVKVPTLKGEKKTIAATLEDAFKDLDEDMGEYLAELEGLTLDLNLAEDELGFSFSVACGSRGAAKLVEQCFGTLAIVARISADSAAVALREGTQQLTGLLPRDVRQFADAKAIKTVSESNLMKTLVTTIASLGQNIEVDRSGSVAAISLSIPLNNLIEDVIDNAVNVAETVMEK